LRHEQICGSLRVSRERVPNWVDCHREVPRNLLARALVCIVIAFAVARAEVVAQPSLSRSSACAAEGWVSPQPVTNPGPSRLARFPTITTNGNEIYVIGTDISFFDATRIHGNRLTIWQVHDEWKLLKPPPGSFKFVFPKGVVDSKGALHLFWGEGAPGEDVESFRWFSVPINKIWGATYSSKSGWSEPRLLVMGAHLSWGPTKSAVYADKDVGVLLALPASKLGEPTEIFRGIPDNWTSTPLPVNGIYLSFARVRSRIYLAYVNASPDGENDVNSVFVMRSDNGGSKWGAPTLVSRSGIHGAYELHLVQGKGRSLHLVWSQDVGNGKSVIRHVSSNDAGSHWSAPDDLETNSPPGLAALSVIPDRCGGFHALYLDYRDGAQNRHLNYVHWLNGWGAPEHLFWDYRAGDATISSNASGILVVFVAQRSGSPGAAPISAMYSRGFFRRSAKSPHARQ
jgi:hypothetical protein